MNSIGSLLTINGNDPTSGSDWLYIDDTGDTVGNIGTLTSTTITGLGMAGSITYGTVEHLVISLGTGGDTFTINSTHGAATSATLEETTLNTGAGLDTIHINSVTDRLFVNGQADTDTINVNGTGAGSESTLNGDAGADIFNVAGTSGTAILNGLADADTFNVSATGVGSITTLNGGLANDIFNIRALSGATTVNGNEDNDTTNVGSLAPSLGGNVNGIGALLTVNGNGSSGGDDILNVDETGEAAANTGELTATTITGLGMTGSIAYATIERLNISLGGGADTLTVQNTHGSATSALLEQTTISTGGGADVVHINNVADILLLNGEAGADIVNVNGTGAGSQSTLNGDADSDTFNMHAIGGVTTINAGADSDTINVGSLAPATNGIVDNIGALLTINGDGGTADVLNLDDTGDGNQNTGTLTPSTITGLDMAGSVIYGTIETLNIGLGSADDTFTVVGTHEGQSVVNGNNGNDIFNLRSISGPTTMNGGSGDETFNIGSNAAGTVANRVVNAGGNVNSIGNDGADVLTLNGNDPASGSDWIYVDDTGDTLANAGTLTFTTITGLGMGGSITYGTAEHLIISLGSGGDTFTINSTHGAATSGFQEDTTLNAGPGADTVHINDVTDLLLVNGQADPDTVNVNGTGLGSASTLHGDDGNDIFNVRAMNGTVQANGDAGDDTTNVGSLAPAGNGSVNSINALLTVNGGSGPGDILNIDDTGDSLANLGNLTSTRLTGLGMGSLDQTVINSALGITYGTLETLNINLGSAGDQFLIESTHTATTTVNGNNGDDKVAVRSINGSVTVNGGNDNDTFNVGHNASPNTAPANVNGVVDQIQALLTVNGGANSGNGLDRLNVDDSGELSSNDGVLTATTLKGLDMAATGLVYGGLEDLNIWLGSAGDRFYVDSTHTATTQVFAGNGTEVVNATDDRIYINTIAGVTSIYGEEGNDFIEVNVVPSPANSWNFVRTHVNGIAAVLNLYGLGGSDLYTVHLANQGSALINVQDRGDWNDGVNSLIIEGADVVVGLENTQRPKDLFLLRKSFVALINDADAVPGPSAGDRVERVNYDERINARLIVRGLGGDDKFVVDDNSSITTLDGGDGSDYFQVGQVFNTPRDSRDGFNASLAGIALDDRFETTAVFTGIVKRADGTVIFDPSTQTLTPTIAAAIEAARVAALALGSGLTGIGYLSNGATHALTVFGGEGNDIFSTYHNRAPVRLEGEEGNDEFVVRALVRLPNQTTEAQSQTELNGGEGNDLIQYTVNAPVSIEGGAGLDSVVVVGTVFPDAFVVSEEGIFGAGLSVRFSGVEKAELDALEGDDQIFIRGTGENIVTTVIAGLGNDTIQVMGDVTLPILSNDLQGGSSLIGHSSSSNDPAFNVVGLDGLKVRISDPLLGGLIDITEPDGQTRVSEDQLLQDSYLVKLLGPLPAGFDTVYLTISAGISSTKDRSRNGDSVEISLDGVTWSKSAVMTLSAAQVGLSQTVFVRAVQDLGVEGARQVMISHSVNSNSALYNSLILRDVAVTVDDDDVPGLIISQLEVDPATNAILPSQDFESVVLEGGFIDAYQLRLNRAPAPNETVTVTLLTDGQVTLSRNQFIFNASNWSTFQAVTISGTDDTLEENVLTSRITHRLSSVLSPLGGTAVFANAADIPLDVKVYDNDTVDIIVRETAGGTKLIKESGSIDSYYLILTKRPDSNVTVSIQTDGQTQVRLGSSGTFTAQLNATFATGSWQTPLLIQVQADLSAPAPSAATLGFPYKPHRLDQIKGPLIIKGGTEPTSNRSLTSGIGLPSETDVVLVTGGSSSSGGGATESSSVDKLNVFNDASQQAASGQLTYRTGLANNGYALTGLGMGGNLTLQTETGPMTYGGGLTYTDIEILELLLGKNKETMLINATPANTVALLHGGGNDDTFNVVEEGGDRVIRGPLVLYGDSSEDAMRPGGRYSGVSGVVGANAISFNNPGNDIINGQSASAVLTIFGGPGNDTLTGGRSGDQIAGGTGNDWIFGQEGDDHIYGDSEFNVDLDALVYLIRNQTDEDREALKVVVGAAAGFDIIRGDEGDDILIGDHGLITQQDGTRRIFSTANVERAETVQPTVGSPDVIYGNVGNDVILGGLGGDFLYGGNSVGTLAAAFAQQLIAVATTESTTVSGKFGVLQNVAITANDRDRIVGDHGFVDFRNSDGITANLSTPDEISSSDPSGATAGDDLIEGNQDNDLILAGLGGDTVNAGTGHDTVLADNGRIRLVSGVLNLVQSTELDKGGADTIRGNEGEDILVGGAYGDRIDGGSERDLIFGDNVTLDGAVGDGVANARYRTLVGAQLYSTDPATAGDVLVTPVSRNIPGGVPVWEALQITFLDHNKAAELAAGTNFGSDYIAGGASSDQIFGQLGNDTIQGDGSIDLPVDVSARRLADGTLFVQPSVENATTDGDDYIEGNGGNDVIFGNLGQDDIIGGSSSLFSLTDADKRTDSAGSDLLFGGAGTRIARDDFGLATSVNGVVTLAPNAHSLDADTIVGDNGNIYRILNGSSFAQFNYDNEAISVTSPLRIIVRAVQLLDYTAGGPDYAGTVNQGEIVPGNIGAADEVHGEGADDTIYGMAGGDILYGEGQNDAIIGGYGNDWISGGTGDDGIIGDDGRIFISRNSSAPGVKVGMAEPLFGIAALPGSDIDLVISTSGKAQLATINVSGALKYTVDLTPQNVQPLNSQTAQNPLFRPRYSDDILFGGLGNDSLHGGAGDDAISGAESLAVGYIQKYNGISLAGVARSDYDHPYNPGDVLRFNAPDSINADSTRRSEEFALYDEYDPLRKIMLNAAGQLDKTGSASAYQYFLNFDATSANHGRPVTDPTYGTKYDDGADVIFGDLGNDWLVGGTGRDNMYGGWGADLINEDDDLIGSNNGANDSPETHPIYEDRAYGGAGRDVLIANTGGDRLIDWAGEFNTYLVPFAPFGLSTVSRSPAPGVAEFLYALSASDGADATLRANASDTRNGEPNAELGLVTQKDDAWGDQTGKPIDPQPGNISGGKRDVLRSSDFNNGTQQAFLADTGTWTVQNGALQVAPSSLHSDAAAVYDLGDSDGLPSYFEVAASISVIKPTAGWKANSYIIFDYENPTSFKFTGIDVSTNKLVMGHRDQTGWVVDKQTPFQTKPDTFYNLRLVVNGLTASLVVDNSTVFTQTYSARIVDGYSYGLNWGLVGFGSDNSRGAMDNVSVQVLPPQITYSNVEDFSDGVANLFTAGQSGTWAIQNARFNGTPLPGTTGYNIMALPQVSNLKSSAYLEVSSVVNTQSQAGFIFDQYSAQDYKFVIMDVVADKLIIGHSTTRSGIVVDASVSKATDAGTDYTLGIGLVGTTVNVTVNTFTTVSYAFNGVTVDGRFGLLARGSSLTSYDNVAVKTNDPAVQSAPVVNTAPVAAGDTASTTKGLGVTIPVLANDTDAQADTLTTASLTQPAHGSVTLNPNGTVTYTPFVGFTGVDVFSYQAKDAFLTSNVATVSVTVSNTAPIALSDSISTGRNKSFTFSVLANDSDADGDLLTITALTQPSSGTLTLNANNTLTFTPKNNFTGTLTFTYKAFDGTVSSSTATATITVT